MLTPYYVTCDNFVVARIGQPVAKSSLTRHYITYSEDSVTSIEEEATDTFNNKPFSVISCSLYQKRFRNVFLINS